MCRDRPNSDSGTPLFLLLAGLYDYLFLRTLLVIRLGEDRRFGSIRKRKAEEYFLLRDFRLELYLLFFLVPEAELLVICSL